MRIREKKIRERKEEVGRREGIMRFNSFVFIVVVSRQCFSV